jgi:hypothetical protein
VGRNDAARYAAKLEPRIRRDRSHLWPMEWVAGDVVHLDVRVRRDDGTIAYPKAVAFQDLANNRLFLRVFLTEKGEMIRREHVLETFVAMCGDPAWGVPTRLLLDHGSEFAALDLAADLFRLKGVAVEEAQFVDPGIARARPYNPQGKVIETAFSALNGRLLPMLPGFVGGNRMVKKTQSQGREPAPYPGRFEQFERDLARVMAYYHQKPQSKRSHLRGQAPDQRFRDQCGEGWQPTLLTDTDKLGAVFCNRHRRRVYAGGRFDLGNRSWRSDELLSLAGEFVIVHEPLFGDRDRLFVFDAAEDRECIAEAVPETTFRWGDPAGAGEQRRQSKVLKKQLQTLGKLAPPLDPAMALASLNAERGQRPPAAAVEQLIAAVPAPPPRRAKEPSSFELWRKAGRKAG